jgi:hypothetical protein
LKLENHVVEFVLPWYSVSHDTVQMDAMERELRRELASGHPLFGLPVKAVARRQDCDDVLFALRDGTGRVAVVHLTWTQSSPERPPWPVTTLFANLEAWPDESMGSDVAE